jgi:predicted nucleic-acid-binding Zn-ribbon protein
MSEKAVFGKHKNDGCLAGLRCPKCGYEDHMYITAESEFTVTDDGTEDNCDVEWNDMSWVRCGDGECGHSGQMWEFQA